MLDIKDVGHFLNLCFKNPSEGLNRILEKKLAVRERVGYYSALESVFVRQEHYELYRNIKPDTTVLDLGALIGDTALYFAMHPNTKRVISYEASPQAFKMLKWNVEYSELGKQKIEVHNNAVASEEGYVANTHEKPSGGNSTIKASSGIKTITLKEILAKHEAPIAIKCDIEGSEKGLFEIDLNKVYAIDLEYHNGLDKEVASTLERKGFTVRKDRNWGKIGVLYAERASK